MGMFDEESFLNTQVEGDLDTKIIPVPIGEYTAHVDDVKARHGESDKGPWASLDVSWKIDDPSFEEEIGRNPAIVRQSIFLDLTENGQLDLSKGKNVRLGKLRDAVGQNEPGQPWSPKDLIGQMATVMVSHRPDKDDPDTVYDEVKKVAPIE